MPTLQAPPSTLELAAWSAVLVAGGRALLALLPVGDAGLRGAIAPVATLTPSALAGLAVALIAGALGSANGLIPFQLSSTITLAAAVLVVVARAALGPAGLVPRHPRLEAPLPSSVSITSVALAIAMLVAAGVYEPLLALALLVAAAVEAGLERSAVEPLARRLAALCTALVAAAWMLLDSSVDAIAFTLALGGGAFAAGWVRRADRRDLALVALLLSALAVRGAHAAGLVGVLFVLAATRRPRLAMPVLACAGVAIVVHAVLLGDVGAHVGARSTWVALTLGLAITASARRGDGSAR